MLIIGERINSTRKSINEAIKSRNAAFILKEARDQTAAGAEFIDVNCAVTSGDEVQDIDWVISVIQSEMPDVSICIDSPNYLAIDRALKVYKGNGKTLINSITADDNRIDSILPLAMEYGASVVALTMTERGMPDTASERADIASSIMEKVRRKGFKKDRLYFDPLIRPVSTEPGQASEFLKAIPLIKTLGEVRIICGLSNVSYGLPRRSAINSAFLAMAIYAGLDAAIVDPTDVNIRSILKASSALLGNDEYCGEYIKAFREGKLI
ncbi:MAG: dihydropteroate synthase [Candidatus Omnitrophica bacterium]|nr:dihydropteroate synthase [Candidatus Omnitrophota bacterium]